MIAQFLLLVQDAARSVEAASEALSVDPSREWINVNLVQAYLFNNQYELAKSVCLKYKDHKNTHTEATIGEVILDDLKTLEDLGITHPDVEKMRALLR